MDDLLVHIDGIGWWTPGIADWTAAARVLRGEAAADGMAGKPAASVLPPNERRRAPEPVLLACDIAGQACAMAGADPAALATVFTSMHGDIGTTDTLCETLASEPLQLSPTKFHNSVHNAPVGYWTIAAHCMAPSSAVSAGPGSFAAGLFEAAVESIAEQKSVLFAAYDIAARGPTIGVIDAQAPFGAALIVSPVRSERTLATLRLRHEAEGVAIDTLPDEFAAMARTNPIAASLPLFAAIARGGHAGLHLRNGARTTLSIEVTA